MADRSIVLVAALNQGRIYRAFGRVRDGTAASDNASTVADFVPRMSRTALSIARRLGA
jgi:hypothetical protein